MLPFQAIALKKQPQTAAQAAEYSAMPENLRTA